MRKVVCFCELCVDLMTSSSPQLGGEGEQKNGCVMEGFRKALSRRCG